VQQAESATRSGAQGSIEVYEYPAGPDAPQLPEWCGWAEVEDAAARTSSRPGGEAGGKARLPAEFEARLAEESRRSFEAGRERGRQEGSQAERELMAAAHSTEAQELSRQLSGLTGSFTQERERYLHQVEGEVVKLALAVAARILRREAQMDPLLLTGAVRVALGQLSGSTQVRLRVPAADLDLWSEAIRLLPNLAVKPTVVAGAEMLLGDCVVETEMGSVDLGIRAQLGEIERGFFDRAGGSRAVNSKVEPDHAAEAEWETRS
jgi:flagellar assembly protein FliH